MHPYSFREGERIKLAAHHAATGQGLDYNAQTVIAAEDGASGGWDVYDGFTLTGEPISFYGFTVKHPQE